MGGSASIALPFLINKSRWQLLTPRQLLVWPCIKTANLSSIGIESFTASSDGVKPSFTKVSVTSSKLFHVAHAVFHLQLAKKEI